MVNKNFNDQIKPNITVEFGNGDNDMSNPSSKILKKEYESAASNLGAKDTEFVSVTEGGVPQTKPEEIAGKVNKGLNKIINPVVAIPQKLGNMLTYGKPFGKQNPWINTQEDRDARALKLANMKAYREKRDGVRDNVVQIINAAKEKNPNMGEAASKELENDINQYIKSTGLSEKDFREVKPYTLKLEDEFGFYSTAPNPYPAIEVTQEAVLGTVGSLQGFKQAGVLTDAFGEKFKYGTKGFVNRYKKGLARAAMKGVKTPGPWWAKALGAIGGGAVGVGIADYGYEQELDILDRAGRAKEALKMSDNKLKNLFSEMIPELATFGPTGINRPEQKERVKSVLSDMVVDAGVSSLFFGARPLYYGLKNAVGGGIFRQFKGRAGQGVTTGKQAFDAEQRLYNSGKFNEFSKTNPAANDLAISDEAALFVQKNVEPAAQDVTMHIPLFGKAITRLMRSPLFNFLSPSDLHTPQNFFKEGKINIKNLPDLAPKLNTTRGTNVQRADIASPLVVGLVTMSGKMPVLGGGIYKNKAQQMDAYMDLGESIIQKLTFAPLINVTEHGVRINDLAQSKARGFRLAANLKQNDLLDAARKYGAVVDDKNFVSMAKRMYEKGMAQRQIVPGDSNFGRSDGVTRVPKVTPEPILNFLKTQVIDPSVAGSRSIEMYYGLRSQMDELYDKWLKNASGESQSDILALYKAWETDIGSLADSGIPEIAKLWNDYEKFVSNGMLMFGTRAGKALTGGIERTGMAIRQVDPDREAGNLFQSVVDIAKADPANASNSLTTMRNLVGDKAYYEGLGIYLNKVFNQSIISKEGAELFDGAAFKKALGLGKDNPLSGLFKKALPGPQVSKLVKKNQLTGEVVEFDNVNFNEGLSRSNEIMPDGITARQAAQLPTQKDLEDFATVMESAAKNGIPEISTFMGRRVVMGGIRSGIKSAMPQHALGFSNKTIGQATAGGVLASMGLGWLIPAGLAYGVRYGGSLLTSPPSLRAYKNMMDDTLPEQTRLANFVRLVRLHPEQWSEFDRELQEVEDKQLRMQQTKSYGAPAIDAAKRFKQAIGSVYDTGKGYLDKSGGLPNNPPIKRAIEKGAEIIKDAPETNYFADEADMSSLGSSIMQNPNMNSAAAASLYEGNLDQALANQAAPRMAAKGGLISLIS